MNHCEPRLKRDSDSRRDWSGRRVNLPACDCEPIQSRHALPLAPGGSTKLDEQDCLIGGSGARWHRRFPCRTHRTATTIYKVSLTYKEKTLTTPPPTGRAGASPWSWWSQAEADGIERCYDRAGSWNAAIDSYAAVPTLWWTSFHSMGQ